MVNYKIKILIIFIIAFLLFTVYSPVTSSGQQNIKMSPGTNIVSSEIRYGYIANANPYINYITQFNRQTMKIVNNITVGYAPAGIVTSPNGSFVYVSNFESNNVSIISTESDEVLTSSHP